MLAGGGKRSQDGGAGARTRRLFSGVVELLLQKGLVFFSRKHLISNLMLCV